MYRAPRKSDNKFLRENKVRRHETKSYKNAVHQHQKKVPNVKRTVDALETSTDNLGTLCKYTLIGVGAICAVVAVGYSAYYFITGKTVSN